MNERSKRKFKRAPLKTDVLYKDQQYVSKARIQNISQGGLLMENLPYFPQDEQLPMAFKIIFFPDFSNLSAKQVDLLSLNTFKQYVIRSLSKIVRSNKDDEHDDILFVPKMGCQFLSIEAEFKNVIAEYVQSYEFNLRYLLSCFENKKSKENDRLINKLAGLLGYHDENDISILRLRILHDYQSLEVV